MDDATFLDQLRADGALLAAAAVRAGWDTSVPGLELTVRALLAHTGAVHRWSADIVRRGLATNETGGSRAFHPDLPDDELPAWYAAGLAALLDTLAAAPADLVTWSFSPGAPARAFWSRRQAHETAIHRADAEAAAGLPVTPFDAAFAQDGLAEVTGFATSFPAAGRGRLALLASDGADWLVRFDEGRITAEPGADATGVDARVSGTSSQLYLWAWNRAAPVVVDGDPAVAALWSHVRIT